MKILITGGTGFLGGAIFKYITSIKNPSFDIFRLSRNGGKRLLDYSVDLTNEKYTDLAIDDIRPDIVFHCASNPNTQLNELNPNGLINDNIGGTHNLLRSIEKYRQGKQVKFIFTSSVTVYGKFYQEYPASIKTSPNPLSLYATTKFACENLVNMYSEIGAICGTSVRLPALVGLGNTHGLVGDLIKKIRQDGKELLLLGNSPGSIKPFCHVDEVAKILYHIALEESPYDTILGRNKIILGNRDSMSVLEVAETMMSYLGHKEIKWSGQSWAFDNPAIYLKPDIITPSNSYNAIVKVCKEFLNAQ